MYVTSGHFSIYNIPFGIFSVKNGKKRAATILADRVIDLYALAELGWFQDLKVPKSVFATGVLNDFIALGKAKTNAVRKRLQERLAEKTALPDHVWHPEHRVKLHLPVRIGDYTDFYSSEQHAYNVGVMFRDPANALLPNWKHLPVGYHGRASSIVVSGVDFHRPCGQVNASDAQPPAFSETKRLDIELEMATIIGKPNRMGQSVPVDTAEDHVFGFALFNDWSARDIQRWEYVPLGPFLAKNFCSSMSPWIVTTEALEPFRVPAQPQNPAVLPYLAAQNRQHFDVALEVDLITPNGAATTICKSNFKYLYWTVAQQIAHHTVNGCNLNIGDVLASGTISGTTPDSFGSLLELSWGGKNPLTLSDGSQRTFLEDGDTVVIRGVSEKEGVSVGFGAVQAKVLPALNLGMLNF
jgi:fumarylacetoacetase